MDIIEKNRRVTAASTLSAMQAQLRDLYAALVTAVGSEHTALESIAARLCERIAALGGKTR